MYKSAQNSKQQNYNFQQTKHNTLINSLGLFTYDLTLFYRIFDTSCSPHHTLRITSSPYPLALESSTLKYNSRKDSLATRKFVKKFLVSNSLTFLGKTPHVMPKKDKSKYFSISSIPLLESKHMLNP